MTTLQDIAKPDGIFTDGDWILSENMDINGKYGVIQLKHLGIGEFLGGKDFNFISDKNFETLNCTEVYPGDILISRMADPIGRACIVPHLPFRCVTVVDATIIRLNKLIADRLYIMHLINSDFIKQKIYHSVRGTTRARITRTELGQIEFSLPPLPEQQRIAAILQQADRLRRLRRTARRLSDTYLQSVFLEMFGNPIKNPSHYELVKLSELGTLDRGISKNRPRNASELFGGSYPFIQTGDVANSNGYILGYEQTYSEIGLRQSKLWPKGTLCITIAANIAKTAILTLDACFPDSVVGFIPGEKTNTEYVQHWLSFMQKQLEDNAPESAQKNINLEILRNLTIPLPPMNLQKQFSSLVMKFTDLKKKSAESERQTEHLFQSLLQRAFEGDL